MKRFFFQIFVVTRFYLHFSYAQTVHVTALPDVNICSVNKI